MQSLAACQRPGGAFLRTGTAKVTACTPTATAADVKPTAKKSKEAKGANGTAAAVAAAAPTFDVVLSDTVLFPEGGGQPTDYGALHFTDPATGAPQTVNVLAVLRTPNGILHRTDAQVPVEAEVTINIDWTRRFDAMQQHSSQHLISAVARQKFGLKTISWWLASAPQECHIEMDSNQITPETLAAIESECNEIIRSGAELKLHTYESLESARADAFFAANMTKAIPETHEGAIRVIEIAGLDFNPCCGTHLASTAQMQQIKLTRVEKGKTSSKIFFLAGGRALQALTASLEVSRALSQTLSCAPEMFDGKVRALQADLRAANKALATAMSELAKNEAKSLVARITGGTSVVATHRDDASLDYCSEVAEQVAAGLTAAGCTTPYLLLVSTSDAFLLVGDEARVTKAGAELATKLGGKGGGRRGRMQGKLLQPASEQTRADAVAWLSTQ